ncbi:MAG TPA: ABC transporter permease [Bryobacteraceae bacterium]|jgi:ABC-2 type transport system permease protein
MNVLTICRKELSTYFRSPIAYGVMFFFALIAGWFFYIAVAAFMQQAMRSMLMGQAMPMDVNEWVVRSNLSNVAVVGLFMVPMITMRLFAEEKRTGTIELLVTSPLRDMEIILGKWLAAIILYGTMLLISLLNMVTLYMYGKPDWRPMLLGYLGLLLQGGAMLAIGSYISSCTKNQIVAAVGGFGVLLLLWVMNWVSSLGDSPLTKVVGYLSITDHFDSFAKGVLDLKDVVFYVSMITLGLFLTARSMESIRWRA